MTKKYRKHCANVPTNHEFKPLKRPKVGLLTQEAKRKVKSGQWTMLECAKCGTRVVVSPVDEEHRLFDNIKASAIVALSIACFIALC